MMNRNLLIGGALCMFASCQTTDPSMSPATDIELLPYPSTSMGDVSDTYFGTTVADPYRWLEDDRSEATAAWVSDQNNVTQHYLDQIPFRSAIRSRLETLWNYERFSAPFEEGEYTYFFKNDGLQNQSVLYRTPKGKDEPELFLDPNTFSKDGTTSLADYAFSKDGSKIAFQISEGGSDWRKVIIWNTEDKSVIGDTLLDVKFSGLSWKGNEGFYYSSYEKPKEGSTLSGITDQHKLFFHKLGTSQSEDPLIFGGPATPRRYISAAVSEDERYLFVYAANTTSGNEVYVQDLQKAGSSLIQMVSQMDKNHSVIDTEGDRLFIFTTLDAPNGRIVTTTIDRPQPSNWKDLIPHTDQVLNPSTGGGKIFANYLKDATSLIKQYDRSGKLEREIELPGAGSAGGFGGKAQDSILYYSYTSYIYPPSIFQLDIASGVSTLYKTAGVDFDPTQFESKQVFYTSKDGTKVPMIITHKKGLELNGQNPTLLYGYGGFDVSLTPSFSTSNIIFLEQGGVYAVANLRGGGEYGEKWHLAGTKMQKQNVFDDFIAAAEYLIKENFTTSEKLAIKGGSNGGLLVGAVMTQRPELFKVAIPEVGVLDMLRYHKFTAGAGWAYDYGTADDSREMFQYLHQYSPYHALKQGTSYPATLVTTADHDDRVVPAHSFKFAARLQAFHQGEHPVLIRIETNAGHGAGKPTAKILDEHADVWSFILQNTGSSYTPITTQNKK
jgi:prolyl oligopeptidase